MKSALMPISVLLSLTGCVGSIVQKVQPIALSGNEPREICLIENATVHHEFLASYKNALSKKGLAVRVLPPGSALGSCPLMTTYDAKWTWDLALYLYYVNLKAYRNNRLEGEALYDAAKGGTKTEKFINAEIKIQELTNQLFPS